MKRFSSSLSAQISWLWTQNKAALLIMLISLIGPLILYGLTLIFVSPDLCLKLKAGGAWFKLSMLCSFIADFTREDVSTKSSQWPGNWSGQGKGNEFDLVKGASLRDKTLRYVMASRAFLVKADLREAKLQKAFLTAADLRKSDLQKAKLIEARLIQADLTEADLRQANLSKADLSYATLYAANLSIFTDCLEGCLTAVTLQGAHLPGADLRQAKLQGADLRGADLQGARLQNAALGMGKKEIKKLCTDKDELRTCNGTNLRETDLRGADLRGAFLEWADLRGTLLDETTQLDCKWKLVWSIVNTPKKDLQKADLRYANLTRADLNGATLNNADLRQVNLTHADLSGATLYEADLRGANLREAKLQNARGLTQKQLDQACVDETTQLPTGLALPQTRPQECSALWEKKG